MTIESGIISSFNDIHGNGLIIPDNRPEPIKFSYKEIKLDGFRLPNEGQRVDYEIVNTIKGPKTKNVVLKEIDNYWDPNASDRLL
jgi:cold shock CspA family protein